jgi:KGK domain
MNNKFKSLEWDEVISVQNSAKILIPHVTFKMSELLNALKDLIRRHEGLTEPKAEWFFDGIECQVLTYGAKDWKKGKVRLTIEFCPDEPDSEKTPSNEQPKISKSGSPLDDLRQKLNEETQQ